MSRTGGRKSPRKTDRDGGAGAKFWLAGRLTRLTYHWCPTDVRQQGTSAYGQRIGAVRFKVHDCAYHTSVEAVRNAVGEDDFQAAWAEGAAVVDNCCQSQHAW
jgi:hypothetical protein